MIPRRSLLLGVLALSGCASLPRGLAYPAAGPFPELEPVRVARSDAQGLSIEIASRGCEARPELVFHVERKGGAATIAFARRRLNSCRDQVPAWAEVAFSWKELGLSPDEPVFLLNPVAAAGIR